MEHITLSAVDRFYAIEEGKGIVPRFNHHL